MSDRGLNYMLCISFLLSSIAVLGAEESPKPTRKRAPRPSAWILNEGKRLYLTYCAPCHGAKGDGNGPNAKLLGKKPADHTDGKKMSARSDWELFQIVNAGGKEAAALSPLMPPWGGTLKDSDVWYLVAFMRWLAKEEAAETAKARPEPRQEAKEVETEPEKKGPSETAAKVASQEKAQPKLQKKKEPAKKKAPPKVAEAAEPKREVIKPARHAAPGPSAERIAKEPEMKPSARRDTKLITRLASSLLSEADASAARFRELTKFNGKPTPGAVKGDPIRGRVYYVANCATCHGTTGKGDGPTAAGMDPKPKDHTEGKTMNKKSDQHLFEVVSQGGPAKGFSDYMPRWGDRLTERQIWDVVAYMRTIANPPYKP